MSTLRELTYASCDGWHLISSSQFTGDFMVVTHAWSRLPREVERVDSCPGRHGRYCMGISAFLHQISVQTTLLEFLAAATGAGVISADTSG